MPPQGWPHDVTYLDSSVPGPSLPASLHSRYSSLPSESSPYHSSKYEKIQVQIRIIDERVPFQPGYHQLSTAASQQSLRHPALGQRGLFALKEIPPHTFIRPYFGRVHTEQDTDPDSQYDMKIEHRSDLGSISVDATDCGNEARFVNDYRSIRSHPNCRLDHWYDEQTGALGMGIFSESKPIPPGSELTINYGKGFWSRYQQHDQETTLEQNRGDPQKSHREQAPNQVQAMLARHRQRLNRQKMGH